MINLEQALSILPESKNSLLLLVEDYSQSHVSRKFLSCSKSMLKKHVRGLTLCIRFTSVCVRHVNVRTL